MSIPSENFEHMYRAQAQNGAHHHNPPGPSHPETCPCCTSAPPSVAQTMEEMDFQRSCCYYASVGDLAKVNTLLCKTPDCVHCDGRGGTSGYTPLHYASRSGHVEVMRALIQAGADVNARIRASQATPLHRAAYCGHAQAVELLIESGAEVDGRDADGKSAVDKAREQGHWEVVERLLLLSVQQRKASG